MFYKKLTTGSLRAVLAPVCASACVAALLAAGAVQAQADRLTPALSGKPRERVILADRIVAVVNDEIVTLRELDERMRLVSAQLRRTGVPLPPEAEMRPQVLERVIIDRAQIQHAKQEAIRVEDGQLDSAVARIAQENNLTMVQFRDAVERDGVSFNRFREDIRTEILLNRVREREVDSRIVISEGEIDNFLAQNKPGGGEQEVNLGQILVRVPENASPDQIEARRKRADDALAQIRGGADFAKIAVSFSDAPEALTGGALGYRQQDRLPQLFVDAVTSLPKDGVSAIVRSPNGFHILKVIDRRGADAAPVVQQTRARHILIKTSQVVSDDQARRRMDDMRERILNKTAEFADLARKFSDDGSGSKGGDLGFVYPGDTVPEFEKTMNDLKLGDLSVPVKSQFGWHLIEVLERKSAEISVERRRNAARQALRERKTDEAYQEWLRQLRDRTFVEYRLEDR